MLISFALFQAVDARGGAESWLVTPTNWPTVAVDKRVDVRGMTKHQQVDLGALRFYADEGSLKIQRLVGQYSPAVFRKSRGQILFQIDHLLPIATDALGYYALLLPRGFYGHLHSSLELEEWWLKDTKRLLVSGPILQGGHFTERIHIFGELDENAAPGREIPHVTSREVYADWSGPKDDNIRAFIRAANASLDETAKGVFICHSTLDKAFALAGSGFRVWIDEAEIQVGESLIDKIETAIKESTYLVAILSESSISSRWCREELKMAFSRQIGGKGTTVLPVLISDCELPEFLQEKKYADFRNPRQFDQSVKQLVLAIGQG